MKKPAPGAPVFLLPVPASSPASRLLQGRHMTCRSRLVGEGSNTDYCICSGVTITQFLSAVTGKPCLAWAAAFLAIIPFN